MTKRVVGSAQVYHLWAHQTQTSARNSSSSCSFDGVVAYSYRAEIGAIFKNKRGTLVLTCSDRFSVTTGKHQGWMRRAISHMDSISCPRIVPQWGSANGDLEKAHHDLNLKYFERTAAEHLTKAKRATLLRTVAWRRECAESAIAGANRYMQFFGIRRKAWVLPELEWCAAAARAESIQNPDPVRDAKKFRERERRQAQRRAALQSLYDSTRAAIETWNAKVAAARADAAAKASEPAPDPAQYWREHGRFPTAPGAVSIDGHAPYYGYKLRCKFLNAGFPELPREEHERIGHTLKPDHGIILLRVNGEEIQTSYGARIPVSHAPRIWRLVQACRSTGRGYARNGHTEHAGPYVIDAIEPDGTLRAGCHTIAYDELALMARTLGLTEEQAA